MTSTAVDYEESSLKALQNEYILEHLFSFLSVNDIKNCRLGNILWMKVGTKILRRRAHVLFDFREYSGFVRYLNYEAIGLKKKKDQMKEVGDYCKENTPENTPISSFAIQGGIEYFQLTSFLDDVRRNMRELKIVSAIYAKEGEKMTIDISPKIPPHLTKLHIELHSFADVTLSLCLDQISFVKDIYLDGCTIVLDITEKRLSPSDITLGALNKYIKNGTKVEFLVSESFDLTLTKRLNLNGNSVIVDFFDCANDQVERNVTLKNITVRNWEKCNWKIKKFYLDGIPFVSKNSIEMEELTTENLQIDLSKIYNPKSLLKLCCGKDTTIADVPFFLPNLVDVKLACENCLAKLPYFTNNKNISKMVLTCEREPPDFTMSLLNINDLPKGINQLSIAGIEVHGEGVYTLPTLNMQGYYPNTECSTFLVKFRSETFKFYYTFLYRDEEMQGVLQLLNLNDSYGRLVVGKFHWEKTDEFNHSVISKYVDRQAGSYVFEGGKGRGLTEEEDLREFGDCITY